jgi:CBS domain-containing protein
MRVAEIMTPDPTALHATDRLVQVAQEMALGAIRHMPIVDRDRVLIGLVTHRDLLRAGPDLDRRIADVMRVDIKTVSPDTLAHEAAYLLLRHAIGCVPVTDDDGRLLGIVTDSDFVRIAYTLLGGRVPVDQLELEEKEAEQV